MEGIFSRHQRANSKIFILTREPLSANMLTLWILGFNTWKPELNGPQFLDDKIEIFINVNLTIVVHISLNFLPKGAIDKESTLIEVIWIWIWPPNFIWTSYELHEKLPDNSCIFPTKFVRSSYEVIVKFIWIESFCYICISSEVHVNFIWNSYVIMCEISKWPWFSYVFHSKFIWHTDQNFQMKFHTNDTNRPS